MKFSQRIGIASAIKSIQINDLDSDLRIGLSNILSLVLIGLDEYLYEKERYAKALWIGFFNAPLEEFNVEVSLNRMKTVLKNGEWFEVYDLLEYSANTFKDFDIEDLKSFKIYCNKILERESSGYRFIGDIKSMKLILHWQRLNHLHLSEV